MFNTALYFFPFQTVQNIYESDLNFHDVKKCLNFLFLSLLKLNAQQWKLTCVLFVLHQIQFCEFNIENNGF